MHSTYNLVGTLSRYKKVNTKDVIEKYYNFEGKLNVIYLIVIQDGLEY